MVLTIRRLRFADIDQVDQVLIATFQESSFKDELAFCLKLQPDGWLVAQKDHSIIGMVGAVNYGSVAQVGLMAVHPAYQGQGIGRTLLGSLLKKLDQQGCSSIRLEASAAGVSLYSKFGFEKYEATWVFTHFRCDLTLPISHQVVPLRLHHLPALSAFDTPIFGDNRQILFNLLLREFSDRAFITYDQKGEIVGYLFAQSNLIGPWVATTSKAAERLLAAALSLPFSTSPIVITPGDNPSVRQLLGFYGFRPPQFASHRHMIRGEVALNQRQNIYGLAHFSLG
ncbi:MAG: GNAT family N-acetyltransferase [Leptolyngbya sp. SIO1E4]|nr:GNAT family N-acetyltransferase [Leptolyngbya sp. SIO1E4]